MSMTLGEYQYLDTDLVIQGIYDWIWEDDGGFARKVVVVPTSGNGIKYNVKTARSTISFQDFMDDIPESSPQITQRSAAVYIAITDAYLSKFAKAANQTQDTDTIELKSKTEDFWAGILTKMILGQTSTLGTVKQPKGMLRLIAELESEATVDLDGLNNSQVLPMAADSGALDYDTLEELVDKVKSPNFMMMNKMARRKVGALTRASGSIVRIDKDEFGKFLQMFGELPIYLNDYVPNNIQDGAASVLAIASYDPSVTRASGYDNTIIVCGRIGDEGSFCINQIAPLTKEFIGPHQKKDADIHRIKWYHGYATYDKYALACLINVQADA